MCMFVAMLFVTFVAFGQTRTKINTKIATAIKQTTQTTDATTQATMTTEETEEKADKPLQTIIAKATELANKLVVAIKSGNTKKTEQAKTEVSEYTETLSTGDKSKFKEIANKILKVVGVQL